MGGRVLVFTYHQNVRPSFTIIEIFVCSLKWYGSYFQHIRVWIGRLVFSPLFPLIKFFAYLLKEFHYSFKN